MLDVCSRYTRVATRPAAHCTCHTLAGVGAFQLTDVVVVVFPAASVGELLTLLGCSVVVPAGEGAPAGPNLFGDQTVIWMVTG